MAKPGKGILDAFSGKLGTVIGGKWNGIPFMRSLPGRRKNETPTLAQEVQRAKFILASAFLRQIGQLIRHSFQRVKGLTGRNIALSNVVTQAIGGVYPNLVIDYSLVQVARGTLKKATNPEADSIVIDKVKFMWTIDSGLGNASPDDKALLVAFVEETGDLFFSIETATRADGEAVLDLPHQTGKLAHTWMAFRSPNGQLVADSSYTGLVAVN